MKVGILSTLLSYIKDESVQYYMVYLNKRHKNDHTYRRTLESEMRKKPSVNSFVL